MQCARLLVWFGDAHQTSGWISAYLASLFWVLGTMTGLYEPAVSLGIIQTIFGVVLSFTVRDRVPFVRCTAARPDRRPRPSSPV